jgi:hypothetical protein
VHRRREGLVRVLGGEGLRTTRELVHACSRGGTFKYFVPREHVAAVWRRLAEAFGPIVRDPVMKTMQIESPALMFRSTLLANPITVIRKRKCTEEDIARMHELVGYDYPPDGEQS